MIRTTLVASAFALWVGCAFSTELPETVRHAADFAVEQYDEAQVELLADLVRFRTVHVSGVPNAENPEFRAFAEYVGRRAIEFGLDFVDYGAVLVVGLGDSAHRLGIVTHGDVQPADSTNWQRSPFELDAESEPGRLIARGTEDDKGPIATALYAMKSLNDLGLPLQRRIELIISLTEESDWAPFRSWLTEFPPPEMNVAIDAGYPVVVAEKGWGSLRVTLAEVLHEAATRPYVQSFTGGAFLSQVPENATLTLVGADGAMEERMKQRTNAGNQEVAYDFRREGDALAVHVRGRAAHASTPEEGVNALAHAAALLDGEEYLSTAAGQAVDFVNSLVGTDVYGSQFGRMAFEHPFMGPLTVNLGTVTSSADGVELAINFRAPVGKTTEQLDQEARDAIAGWAASRNVPLPTIVTLQEPAHMPEEPPHVPILLAVFRHYTGLKDAQPISIGGGTHARLVPNGVNFGPAMPGVPYSGHSEHEFITREQMSLNLRMYTAMLALLAGDG